MAKKVKCPKMKKTKVKRDLRHNTNRKTIIKRNRKKSSSGKNINELNIEIYCSIDRDFSILQTWLLTGCNKVL